jgi:hypothetical protein
VAIRPEDIVLQPQFEEDPANNSLRGVVEAALFVGDRYEVRLQLDNGERVFCYSSGRQKLEEGRVMSVRFPQETISLWPV